MSLRDYGWDEFFSDPFDELRAEGEQPARICRAASGIFRLQTEQGTCTASTSGRLRHQADDATARPAVGDWVAAALSNTGDARIERVLPRRSSLSRKVSGKRVEQQIVAANVDLVIVVMALDDDYNVRRLERFLTTVSESGAEALVLLNKTDLCDEVDERLQQVEQVTGGAPVLPANCKEGSGVDAVRGHIAPRKTAVLVGSSGVGKSTLINRLLGDDVQRTLEVREGDSKGRHATTHRELFRLPNDGLLIDSPGIRELQLWGEERSLEASFEDIVTLGADCRYRDCSHESEGGCAVLEAVANGKMTAKRLASYHDLQKELRFLEVRRNESAQRVQKKKWRAIHKEMRRSGKNRKR